jgi:outer membrane lipoprotein-sorting protein
MTNFFRIFAASSVLTLAALATAGSTTQPATRPTTRMTLDQLNQLQSVLKNVTTVEADFVEEKNLVMLNHTLTIRGHFALQKPSRLIWIVREPVKYAIRIEGDEIRQWDEDTNRVDVLHLGGDPTFQAVSQQMQAWFLGDYDTLSKSYVVQILSEHPLSLRFFPQPDSMMAKVISQVDLFFAQDERYIQKMVLDEAGGNVTALSFIHTRVNEPIADDVWRMPPNE